MPKYKVVQFIDGVAHISMTRDLSGIQEDKVTTFINPILTHLKGVAPELWTVFNSQIVEIKDEAQRQNRLKMLTLKHELSSKGDQVLDSLIEDLDEVFGSLNKLKDKDNNLDSLLASLSLSKDEDVRKINALLDFINANQVAHIKRTKRAIVLAYLGLFLSYIILGGFYARL